MTPLSCVDEPFLPDALMAPVTHGGCEAPVVGAVSQHALVVDDEALIRWSVSETLSGMGMTVQEAGDAAGALAVIAAATAPFDVVILDLRLPDMDDLSLLERVRQLLPEAVVVLMTAFGTAEIVAEAAALGVHAVLNKPFELDELSRLLSRDGPPS